MSYKNNPDTCTHKHFGRYVTEEVCTDWETGEKEYESNWVEPSAVEDLDLHRMVCTLCGKISYYSGRAREYYEERKTEHSEILFPAPGEE
jgi:hypothetical protein